jgi:hypothetical protein
MGNRFRRCNTGPYCLIVVLHQNDEDSTSGRMAQPNKRIDRQMVDQEQGDHSLKPRQDLLTATLVRMIADRRTANRLPRPRYQVITVWVSTISGKRSNSSAQSRAAHAEFGGIDISFIQLIQSSGLLGDRLFKRQAAKNKVSKSGSLKRSSRFIQAYQCCSLQFPAKLLI